MHVLPAIEPDESAHKVFTSETLWSTCATARRCGAILDCQLATSELAEADDQGVADIAGIAVWFAGEIAVHGNVRVLEGRIGRCDKSTQGSLQNRVAQRIHSRRGRVVGLVHVWTEDERLARTLATRDNVLAICVLDLAPAHCSEQCQRAIVLRACDGGIVEARRRARD
jgi:hypothetical protein